MRITLVSVAEWEYTGVDRSLAVMANEMISRGHQVTVLVPSIINPDPYGFFGLSVRVKLKDMGLKKNIRIPLFGHIAYQVSRLKVVRERIDETSPDVVVSFGNKMNLYCLLGRKHFSVPLIVSERTDPRMHKIEFTYQILRKKLYPFADAVVAQTPQISEYLSNLVPTEAIVTIPNPVRPMVSGDPPSWFMDYVRENDKVIVLVGRLEHQKGFDLFLEAFGGLAGHFPEWKVLILGEGKMRGFLERSINAMGLKAQVHLVGVVKDPEKVLRAADLFVLSSRFEGFPNALIEAMACGLPCVSFDCPSGPSEIIQNRVNGLLVPPEDVSGLAHALDIMMKDCSLREEFVQNSAEVLQCFSFDSVMDTWEDLLKRVVSGKGHPWY